MCFCLAPIRVLQCFCQEATPDKCPSGCPYLDHNLICDIWLYRIKYTAGITKTGQKAIPSRASFVDFFPYFLIHRYINYIFLSQLNFLAVCFEMRIVCHIRIPPQRQHCNCQLPGNGNNCFLFGNSSTSCGYSISKIPQIAIFSEWSHYILRSLYK